MIDEEKNINEEFEDQFPLVSIDDEFEGVNVEDMEEITLDDITLNNETGEFDLNDDNNVKNEEEEEDFELTFDEKKKILRLMGKKNITEEEINSLSDEQIQELKDYMKLRHRKSIIKFVERKKHVTDDEANELSKEDFLELTKKALIMSKFLTYNTKKKFGVQYKKKRQKRNNATNASRRANRK
jgi:hypothetical protein